MAVTRLTTNGLTGTKYDIASADNYYMEPIATTLVGSGGVASITFSGILNTYKHLQIRALTSTASSGNVSLVFNADASASYSSHRLYGTGSGTPGASASTSETKVELGTRSGEGSNFGVSIIDILDYANTNKYKTTRNLSGYDANGSGIVYFSSGLWQNTGVITSIKLTPQAPDNFNQYSRFSLYGIKG